MQLITISIDSKLSKDEVIDYLIEYYLIEETFKEIELHSSYFTNNEIGNHDLKVELITNDNIFKRYEYIIEVINKIDYIEEKVYNGYYFLLFSLLVIYLSCFFIYLFKNRKRKKKINT